MTIHDRTRLTDLLFNIKNDRLKPIVFVLLKKFVNTYVEYLEKLDITGENLN